MVLTGAGFRRWPGRPVFRIVTLLGAAALLSGALTGAADPAPPTCTAPQEQTVRADPPQPLAVSISCSDPAGVAVSHVVDDGPAHGELEPHSNSPGVYSYAPDDGYEGTDAFTVHAASVNGESEPVE